MSYCVNCGVELDKSAKKCPLCSTPVINPNAENAEKVILPFPERVDIPESVNRRFTAFIITMVMLIPNIVCILVNIIFFKESQWALLVNSTSLLVWALFVLPFLWKKLRGWLTVIIDTAFVIGYAYVFYYLDDSTGWFQYCALPIIIILAFLVGFIIEWKRYFKPSWPALMITLMTELILASISSELILRNYLFSAPAVKVSLIISACCVTLIAFFIAVATNKRLQLWMGRRFFVN